MKKKTALSKTPSSRQAKPGFDSLLGELRTLIVQARQQALRAVDLVQVRTCWEVGRHIVEFEQGGRTRAEYGAGLLAQVATRLTAEFGSGFDQRNLRNMRAFYQAFPNWNALRPKLNWTHYRLLLRLDDPHAREWYAKETEDQNWSTRQLERQIGTLYYERLLASKDRKAVLTEADVKLAEVDPAPRDFVRDPVMLEFLGLPGTGRLLEGFRQQKLLQDPTPPPAS